VGIDLSLTGTGVSLGPQSLSTVRHKAPQSPADGFRRLQGIRAQVLSFVALRGSVAILEGYSQASKHQAHQLGELGGVVRLALFEEGVPFYVVTPSQLKVFATGKGNSAKEQVGYSAVKRFGVEPKDNNQADALWLWEIGNHLLGEPTVELPKTHTRALDAIGEPVVDPS